MQQLVISDDTSYASSDEVCVISPEKGDNLYDLNKYVDHNECQEILCTLTDYIPTNKLSPYIGELSAKLAHGGKLTIIGTDALEVVHAFKNGRMDILAFNELVYGKRNKVWAFKQSLISLHDVTAIMRTHNLKITQKRISDFTYSVVGERE